MSRPERSLAAALLATCAWGMEAEAQRQSYAASYAAEAAGEVEQAIAALAPVRTATPRDYLLNLRLGWLAWRAGRPAEAVVHYRAASRVQPRSLEPHLGLLRPLLALGRPAEAEIAAWIVLRDEPGNTVAACALAEALAAEGYPSFAADVAQRASERHPADPGVAATRDYVHAQARPQTATTATVPQSGMDQATRTADLAILGYVGDFAYGGQTDRRSAHLEGAYASLALPGMASLELAVERLRLAVPHLPDAQQADATAILGGWSGAWWLRGGAHLVRDSTQGWDAARCAFAGAWWQPADGPRLGADLSLSRFAIADPALTAAQVTPGIGWSWSPAPGWSGGLDLDATVIRLSRDLGDGTTLFASAGARLSASWRGATLAASAWSGGRRYAVTGGGFAVYDLPATFRRGADLRLSVTAFRHLTCAIAVGREDFSETWLPGTAHVLRVVGSLGCTF